jgi:response regulator of citrate/malate metabolism
MTKSSQEVLCLSQRVLYDIEFATASSVKTYKTIKTDSDLIFLDIEMADGKGFDLLSMFEDDFKLFCDCLFRYAVKAFSSVP